MSRSRTRNQTGYGLFKNYVHVFWPLLEEEIVSAQTERGADLRAVGVHNLCIIQAVKCPSKHAKGPDLPLFRASFTNIINQVSILTGLWSGSRQWAK